MKKLVVTVICALPAIQAFGWSTLTGVIGTLILAGFFSTIMSLELLSMLLPLVVGVNASFSGYMLIERHGDQFARQRLACAGLGLLLAALSVAAINLFCMQVGRYTLLSSTQGLAALGLGMLGALAGGILAIKYRQLKEQPLNG